MLMWLLCIRHLWHTQGIEAFERFDLIRSYLSRIMLYQKKTNLICTEILINSQVHSHTEIKLVDQLMKYI